jgi:uncharacterized protein (DUF1501 family)
MADAALYAPEAMLLTAPFIINWLNSATSLIRNGLQDCDEGFSQYVEGRKSCGRLQNWRSSSWIPPTKSGAAPLMYAPDADATTAEIISELDLLLTDGRLNAHSRAIIEAAYDKQKAAYGEPQALQLAQQLLIISPEFHTSAKNDLVRPRPAPKAPAAKTNPLPYKAIVFLWLAGGCDSYSLLMPYDGCEGEDRYQQYLECRTDIALSKEMILPIDASEKSPGSKQACKRYGINWNMPTTKKLYDEGDVLFFANTGAMIAPVDKHDIHAKRDRPKSLFGHNTMTRYSMNLHASNFESSLGVIGRMMDDLAGRGATTATYSVGADRTADSLNPRNSTPYDILSAYGVKKLTYYTDLSIGEHVNNLTSQVSASPIAETWASQLRASVDRTNNLEDALRNAPPLKQEFKADHADNYLGMTMKQVAKLISINKDTHERDAFHVRIGGFDTHNDNYKTGDRLAEIDEALKSLEEEAKLQGVWDQLLIVQSSEFARTAESNGGGSDHAWGGNYFIMGGAVKGGQILGQYPELVESSPLYMRRGRIVPTTSWEMIWNGVAKWFGVDDSAMDDVLPLKHNFQRLFTKDDLFEK